MIRVLSTKIARTGIDKISLPVLKDVLALVGELEKVFWYVCRWWIDRVLVYQSNVGSEWFCGKTRQEVVC